MSAPIPDFDQLLSDHLDGRLDENDTHLLEARLREDAALRSQYESMLADRQDLKTLFAVSEKSQPRLPKDFAARVVAESRRRGLKVASDSAIEPATVYRRANADVAARGRTRIVLGVVAAAAAVLLVISLNFSGKTDVNNVQSVAQNSPGTTSTTDGPIGLNADEPKPSAIASASVEPVERNVEQDTEPASTGIDGAMMAATPDVEIQDPSVDSNMMSVSPKPARDALASSESRGAVDNSASVSVGAENSPLFADSPLAGAVMVYDVRLSSKGRVTGAFAQAMQRNGLDESSREKVSRDVIAAAQRADVFEQDEKFQIVFLQAPAKKVDRLFLDLLRDRESVESVGLSLVTDTPILKMTDQLVRVDATQVKHRDAVSLQLGSGGNDAELNRLRDLLGEQAFMPLNAPAPNVDAASESLSTTGTDVITRVLILVR
ncbi:anti-sigma factor family protein [Aporhodopirellula aestuarii]|uniref:Uncharacterized protein n=1 Tax=Aporhodopirellula aestuarii TaxID=2950107 RepID=A0ABT0U5P5_9BACT|nr:hypothetical protein [Aporhodopirellula aestuarii]MCM2372262.1 hypothetical protein [Aporhodopirellula aestuarii]